MAEHSAGGESGVSGLGVSLDSGPLYKSLHFM